MPTNYKTLELNEAMHRLVQPRTTYNDVVTAAADEAGGQGFVTELAGPTAMQQHRRQHLTRSASRSSSSADTADGLTPAELIVQVDPDVLPASAGRALRRTVRLARPRAGGWRWTAWPTCSAKHLKLPTGVTVATVLASPRCYFAEFRTPGDFYCDGKPAPAETIDLTGFDRVAFLTDVEKLVDPAAGEDRRSCSATSAT